MAPSHPTPLPEVNAVLADLVVRWRQILGENLVGAYLQGSFAVGDFNDHSDVDFIVIAEREITAGELAALQALHAEMHARPLYWAHHLEGSYAPRALFCALADEPREPAAAAPCDPGTGLPRRADPFWFLGNGEKSLVRSEHDNSRVARWVVRERGITLCGPGPKTLIDPISREDLRREVRRNLSIYCAPYVAGSSAISAVWQQAFFVTLVCRMLHTLEAGEVHSKKACTAWALGALPAQWHGLIERAAATWAGPQELWHNRPDAPEVALTLKFMSYAMGAYAKEP